MCDLEDKILKKNIPGKYTWWDKDSDEEGEKERVIENDNDEPLTDEQIAEKKMTDMQKVQKWEEVDMPKPLQIAALNNMRGTQAGAAHTGPKGVLADYKQAKKDMELQYEIDQQYKEMLIEKVSNGVHMMPGETSISAATMNAIAAAEVRRDQEDQSGLKGTVEKDDAAEDEEFLKSYRDTRLSQLKYSTNHPTFGEIRECDPFEFTDEVDNADPRAFVVVHMYEPYIDDCKKINRLLESLARKMSWCKFLRLHCFKANPNFDVIALPVIMVYKGGELVENWVKVTDDLPPDFGLDDIQWLLENAGVVNPESVEVQRQEIVRNNFVGCEQAQENEARNTHGDMVSGRAGPLADEYDSDDADLDAFCDGFENSTVFMA
jgi:hypothetical protein